MYNAAEAAAEESLRRRFVHKALDAGIQLIQLPCPEFTLYGARRWGHTEYQFDNPFFRRHCQKLLQPVLLETEEYLQNPGRFEILGFLGVDGSPSCGVKYTCKGCWGGNLSNRDDINEVIAHAGLVEGRGVFFEELTVMLSKKGISLPLKGLYALEPEHALNLVGD